uniref:Ig-like domain-containing protein n=1 Tax=Oreochromis aureus TaxID=47969 RepID=A0AAZ1X568_OREAU
MAHEGGPAGVGADEESEKTKPDIVLLPEPARVLEGDIARFRCRVTGYPAPKVNWYLNGQLIRKSKRYRLRYDGIYYLEIVDIKSYDSGEVRVVADNPLGTAEHTVNMEAPKILERIASKTVAPMDEVRFRVRVSGVPQPQVFWYKNSQALSSEFFRISQFDDSCQLEISRVYPEDDGEYTCMATNNGGTVSCSATLTLDGEFITKKKGCFSYSETIEVSITEAHSIHWANEHALFKDKSKPGTDLPPPTSLA